MCRLLTPELKEALQKYPLYSQDGKGKNAVCCAVFELMNARWYILEGVTEEEDTTMFGIVIGMIEDEYGYISLNELSEVEADFRGMGLGKQKIRPVEGFKPTPLHQIYDPRLQRFLIQMED